MRCYFQMRDEHTKFADEISAGIYAARVADQTDFVGHIRGDDPSKSYQRGIRMEVAFYLWLGGKDAARGNFEVHKIRTRKMAKEPDIWYAGYEIDVKSRPENPVYKNHLIKKSQVDHDNRIYVLGVYDEYPFCIFDGWLWGRELKTYPIGGREEVPAFKVPSNDPLLTSWQRDCMQLKWRLA
jgi:hypothetical protein